MASVGLDLPTALLCIVMAFALSLLHILSSPSHRHWLTLPQYVRGGFFVTALGMLFRGVDLLNLAKPEASTLSLGHIDAVGFVLTGSMTFTICALAFHALCNTYGLHARVRVEPAATLVRLATDSYKVAEPVAAAAPDS